MGKEIAFVNGRNSDIQGLVTLTLTLDRVILHTIMHQSSTSTYTYQISLKSKKLFVGGRTDVRTGGLTFETGFIRSTRRSRPKNQIQPKQMQPMIVSGGYLCSWMSIYKKMRK